MGNRVASQRFLGSYQEPGWNLVWLLLATFLVGYLLGPLPTHGQETEPLSIKLTSSTTAQTQPGLLVLILDHSGSMSLRQDVPKTYSGKTRWQASLADAEERIDAALKAEPGVIDLRVYTFDTDPADYGRYRPLPRLTKNGGSQTAKAALSAIRPPDDGATTLYTSVRNVAQGLVNDGALSIYGWVWVVLYSDGDDSEFKYASSERRDNAKAAMCAALTELAKSPRVSIDYLPIGNVTMLDATCGGLRRTRFNEIKPPVVYQLITAPDPLRLAGGKAGGKLPTRLKMDGVGQPGDMRFGLLGAPAGLSVDFDGDEHLVWGLPSELSDGARFKMQVSVPLPESTNRLTALHEVIVPPIATMPQLAAWGLPAACPEEGGRRVVLVERGQPVVIAPNLPADAQVKWTVSPGGRDSASPSFREILPIGSHEIRVTASRPGSQEVSETILAHVIEPKLLIEGSGNAAKDATAGTDYPLVARLQGNPPAYVRKALESAAGAWRVAGQRQEARGLSINANFPEAGSMGVDFSASLDACNGSVQFRGSGTVTVKPGVSIRNLTTRLVEGYPGRIEVEVSDRDQVDRVDVSIDGGRTWHPTRYNAANKERLNVDCSTESIAATDLAAAKGPDGSITAWLRPIRRLASGVISERTDPENIKRERRERIPLGKPEVETGFLSPLDQSEAPYGKQVEVSVQVSGRERELVRKVELRVGGPSGRKLADMAGGQENADRTGALWRSAGFKADEQMGRDVQLVAQARDAEGRLLGQGVVTVHPSSPRPILVLTGTNGQNLQWSGGLENVPTVVARMVESGSSEPYPDSAVGSVTWRVSGALEMLPAAGNRNQIASFRPIRRGDARIEAVITAPSGQTHPPAILDIKVQPAPLTAENAPQIALFRSGKAKSKVGKGDFHVRGSETLDLRLEGPVGAYSMRTIELIRGGDQETVKTEQGIDFAGLPASLQFWRSAKPVECRVRVTWVPWGEPREAAVFREQVFHAVAGPPKLAVIVLVLATLLLVLLFYRLGNGNNLLGQTVQWLPVINGQPNHHAKIGLFNSEGRFRLLGKKAQLQIPDPPNRTDEFIWMREDKYKEDRVVFQWKGIGVADGSRRASLKRLRVELTEAKGVYEVAPKGEGNYSPIYLEFIEGLSNPTPKLLQAFSWLLIAGVLGGCYYLLAIHPWFSK
jgi:hypothetical protein